MIKILMAAIPGGDRGPAIGYRQHLAALLSSPDFKIDLLTQEMWSNPSLMRQYDVVWGYVRFHQDILKRCNDYKIPFISGPNVVLERGDLGPSDDWEKWFFEEAKIDVNLNVANYYTDRVKSFVKTNMKCKTLEYCYEDSEIEKDLETEREFDVLIYSKNRVQDNRASEIAKLLDSSLKNLNLKTVTIDYGDYPRKFYTELCKKSKVAAWLAIEDYCSLGQIEMMLSGCRIIGTPWNLTIPTFYEDKCHESQTISSKNWIQWNSNEEIISDYTKKIVSVLSQENLAKETCNRSKQRFSYEYYRRNVKSLIEEII